MHFNRFNLSTDGAISKNADQIFAIDSVLPIAKIKRINNGALAHFFYGINSSNATKISGNISFPVLASIDTNGMYETFYYCKSLTGSVSFPSLTSVGDNGLKNAFYNCTGLTGNISFPVLTTIGKGGMYGVFDGCTGLIGSVSFPSLTSVGTSAMIFAFYNTGITTVHFKSSLSSNTELTAYNIFGTTSGKSVLFDLP
jgi:hypothetical protein